MKRLRWVVFLVVALAAGFTLFWLFWPDEQQDLSLLTVHSETQSYEALIKTVQEQPVPEDGFRFVALGDTRSNINIARNVLSRVVEESPAFILSNGDIVRRGRVEEYVAHHFRLVDQVYPIPFIPAPGNHESGPNGDFASFEAVYGGQQFSFDYGNCRFVGFNNGDSDEVSKDDLRYLDDELGKPGATFKFVVCHVPPAFLENAVESDEGRGFDHHAGEFRELMSRHKVDHVFLGHVHGYATETFDGVRYTITGGAGADLTSRLTEEGRVHNFVVIQVTPEGLRREVVWLAGEQWTRTEIP